MFNYIIRELTKKKFRLRYLLALFLSSLSGIFDLVTTAVVFFTLKQLGASDLELKPHSEFIMSVDLSSATFFMYLIGFVIFSGLTRIAALRQTTFLSFEFSEHILSARLEEILLQSPLQLGSVKSDLLQSIFIGKANSFCMDFIFSILYAPVAILNILFILASLFLIGKPVVLLVFLLLGLGYGFFVILQKNKLQVFSLKNSALQTEQSLFFHTISLIDVDLKLHRLVNKYVAFYKKINGDLRRSQASIMFYNGLPRPTVETFGMVILLFFAFLAFRSNDISVLYTIPIIGYIGLKLLPLIQSLFQCYTLIRSSLPVARDLFQVASVDQRAVSANDYINLSGNVLKVKLLPSSEKFTNLTFGDVLAIHGPSGSGKTTLLLSLMSSLYGKHTVCYVGQKGYVINASLRENMLLLSSKNYSDDFLVALSKSFGLSFVEDESSLDVRVGSHSRPLSGGEEQRLSILRALLADPEFLLLDEPTSALNKDLSELVINFVRQSCRNRVLVFVTHDLSIIKPEDFCLSLS